MRLKWLITACGLSVLLLLGACSQNPAENSSTTDRSSALERQSGPEGSSQQAGYHKITAQEAKALLDDGNAIVVDVRTQAEYEERHIPGAILVPNETIQNTPPEKLPDQNAVLLIYCRTGVRSKQAAEKLVAMGYTQVYDFGGIHDWPYDTVSGGEEEAP